MAKSSELFISVPPQMYLESKSSVLMSQAELLQMLKRLQNLRVLSRRKNDLKKNLHTLIGSITKGINLIQKDMPSSTLPKIILKHEKEREKENKKEKAPEVSPKTKKPLSKRDIIEEELKLINAKLKALNS